MFDHTQPPTPTSTHSPAKRSLLLLRAVFHVSSTLFDTNAEYDSRDGENLGDKVHLCLPAGGLRLEPKLEPPDIFIIDVL